HAALDGLLRRAQEAGGVRRDVGADDLVGLVVGIARAAEYASWDPGARDRALRVLFDGLRTGT
ncbi:MAG: TetR/AcrR family transcriptional regulator, partial [Candidatus Dormiibacterota bacterium]